MEGGSEERGGRLATPCWPLPCSSASAVAPSQSFSLPQSGNKNNNVHVHVVDLTLQENLFFVLCLNVVKGFRVACCRKDLVKLFLHHSTLTQRPAVAVRVVRVVRVVRE